MKKLFLTTIFAAIFISPALGNVTIEALDPGKGEMLITYQEGFNVKAGTSELLCGVYPSADKKPYVRSAIDVNSKQTFMAKMVPLKKNDKTIPGKYQVLIRFKEPPTEDAKFLIQSKLVVYNSDLCYINEDSLWVTKWLTSYKCDFIAPKGHIPVFTSLPVTISEYYGRIQLSQDPLFIENNNKTLYRRTLVFKTKVLPEKKNEPPSQ